MKKIWSYSILLSLTILFLFLALLHFRMYNKLLYKKAKYNLADIVAEAYDLGYVLHHNEGNYYAHQGDFNVFHFKYSEYLKNFPENNPDARQDYLYTISYVSNDIEVIYKTTEIASEVKEVDYNKAIQHLQYLKNEHRNALVFTIIYSSLFVFSASCYIVFIFKNKPKFEDVIDVDSK